MFYVYSFDLSDRIWLVSIVMVLVVACLLGCVFLTILSGPPYIPFLLVSFAPAAHDVYSILKFYWVSSAS